MIIDSHQHFWNYNPEEYGWINNEMAVIRKKFLIDDLKETISDTEVTGVISVHARQCMEETDWLLQLASENEVIKGVVGWVPLASKSIHAILERYASSIFLKGVRHVVQEESDPEFLLREDFNRGISLLHQFNLVYDILILKHQLPNTIRFVDKHPNQIFVVDHIAKPLIKDNKIKEWQKDISELAKRKNVFCKLSGMVSEADFSNWTVKQLQPYFDVILETFGPNRLIFGSNWPVCLVGTTYKNWLDIVKSQILQLSNSEQDLILYKNAESIYKLLYH